MTFDEMRPKTYHYLKLKAPYVRLILEGKMRYQIRYNDRAYQSGDYIKFHVVDLDGERVSLESGSVLDSEIERYCTAEEIRLVENREYIISGVGTFEGLEAGYVAFTISIK